MEAKRLVDQAKMKINELKDAGITPAICEQHGFAMPPADSDKAAYDAWFADAAQKVEAHLEKELQKRQEARMPHCIVPDPPLNLNIGDKEGNQVWRCFVFKAQAEDALKALRRKNYTPRLFSYNKDLWEKENAERKILEKEVLNATNALHKTATAAFQQLFSALIHLKVLRAYIEGVLRFGVPPDFYIGIVMPRKGSERLILQEMCNALADESMREMYGEKQDANDAEDYWPFVSIPLTSPNFLHGQKD